MTLNELLNYLREMNMVSVLLRLALAMFFGGLIGLERAQKRRPAGLRTYMIVCIGAALAMMIGQYEAVMMNTGWAELAAQSGAKADASRIAAQVINGIGFLGAGIIIVTNRREVTGLTTASGIWVSACFGIAIGAAFYEVLPFAAFMIILSIRGFPVLEKRAMVYSKHMILFVEFASLRDIAEIITCLKTLDIKIDQVDLERNTFKKTLKNSNAVFFVSLKKRVPHSRIIAEVEKLETVNIVYEM